jgi:hypothetical protein
MNDGGCAFPYQGSSGYQAGMSLRDYFATQAMASLLANPFSSREIARDVEEKAGHNTGHFGLEIARNAYDCADAMLLARKISATSATSCLDPAPPPAPPNFTSSETQP